MNDFQLLLNRSVNPKAGGHLTLEGLLIFQMETKEQVKRYFALMRRIDKLTPLECQEFHDLMESVAL